MQESKQPEKPAWQTEELEDEWIDIEDEHASAEQQAAASPAQTTSDLSFTQLHGSILVFGADIPNSTSSMSSLGTVLIRDDMPAVAILPQTPGNAQKGLSKNFFSPLPLERMFEPPSPPSNAGNAQPSISHKNAPVVPSRLSRMYVPEQDTTTASVVTRDDEYLEDYSAIQDETQLEGEEVTFEVTNYRFTFAAPGPNGPRSLRPASTFPMTPQAVRVNAFTPSHLPAPPATDPRLRLFQFQYDTFTRDHLSAMVDSIAIHSPAGDSGTANSKESSPAVLNFESPSERSLTRLRSAKRLKLSPASDFSGDGEAVIIRPQGRKDYVGESISLMDKIRQARDFSTISTRSGGLTPLSSAKRPEAAIHTTEQNNENAPHLAVPVFSNNRGDTWTTTSSKRLAFSSSQIREQAADLMAQIRSDVRSHKRLFSVDSANNSPTKGVEQGDVESVDSFDIEPINYGGDTEIIDDPDEYTAAPTTDPRRNQDTITLDLTVQVNGELTENVGQMSLESQSMLEQFPPLPIAVIVPASPTSSRQSSLSIVPSEEEKAARLPYLSPYTAGIPPAYPSTSQRLGVNEDLNRFVSSSTTASGATIASGASSTLVKHEGGRPIKLITPDSQSIPERLGEMVFDQQLKKWVKASTFQKDGDLGSGTMKTSGSNESEDPFRDIESFHEDNSPMNDSAPTPSEGDSNMDLDASQIRETHSESESEDEEEAELTSFSFDGPSLQSAEPSPAKRVRELGTDSEDDRAARKSEGTGEFVRDLAKSLSEYADRDRHPSDTQQPGPALQDTPPHLLAPSGNLATPLPAHRDASATLTPVIRSAMKSRSVTPVSVLKDSNRARMHTPANRLLHRRSVSFSDGKRDGPIVGIGRNIPTPDVTTESDGGSTSDDGTIEQSAPLAASARSKRIADMLEDLEDTSYDDESPSKASSGKAAAEGTQPLTRRKGMTISNPSGRARPRRSFSQSYSTRSLKFTGGNATFLTECSFGVAHDRLVQVITDVQPFEPHWEGLSAIDLSRKDLDSVARLKEFLPKLDSLSLNSNHLAWLSGIPSTVRTLSVAWNCLTTVTSFSHLHNLESLDISNNNINSLRQLECLRHLRELRADGNVIDSVDGLQKMDGLVKLSLQGNEIQDIDLANYRWARLEMLNLCQNRLSRIAGISAQSLPALTALNLDHNNLRELEAEGTMVRLKILRVSGNRLPQFNAWPFPNLRTLYADNNSLGPILKAHRLTKLENLSLRNQTGRAGLSLSIHDVRDVKRLYLSGNPMKSGFISEPCYNLLYLELAACRLTSLPTELSRLTPNLRVLNLNYNFLDDVRPLQGLTRLRKLTIIGSRVKATRDFVRMLRGMQDVEMLDFRMNPCTLGWYLPLLVKDVPGALQPSDGDRHLPGPSSAAALQTEFNVSPGQDTARSGNSNGFIKARGINGASPDHQDHHGVNPTAGAADPHSASAAAPAGGRSSSQQRQQRGPRHAFGGGVTWKDLDSKFRRDLPDDVYVGRLAYRGLVMRACPAIRTLDGVEVSEKERDKAERLLESVLAIKKKPMAPAQPAPHAAST